MEKMQKLRTPYRKMKDRLKAYAHFGMGGVQTRSPSLQG